MMRQTTLMTAESVDPNRFAEQIERAKMLMAEKCYALAAEELTHLIALGGASGIALTLLGDCLTQLNNLEDAERSYRSAIEIDSMQSRSYSGLGILSILRDRPESARAYFDLALEYDRQSDRAHAGKALVLTVEQRFEEAFDHWLEALNYNPTNEVAIFYVTQIAAQVGRLAEAEIALEQFLQRRPDDHDIRIGLAGICVQRRNLEKAREQLQIVLDADPTHEIANEIVVGVEQNLQKQKELVGRFGR